MPFNKIVGSNLPLTRSIFVEKEKTNSVLMVARIVRMEVDEGLQLWIQGLAAKLSPMTP